MLFVIQKANPNLVLGVLALFVALAVGSIIYLHGSVTDVINAIMLGVAVMGGGYGLAQNAQTLNSHLDTHSQQSAAIATSAATQAAQAVLAAQQPPNPAP